MHERVSDLLRTGRVLVYISPSATVLETVETMDKHNVGSILVMDNHGHLCGIFTERDLLKRVAAKNIDQEKTRIDSVMTDEVIVVDATTSAADVFQLMNRHGCRHIPVADGERLLGVVSLRDLLREDRKMKELEIKQMRRYIYNPSYPA